MAKTRHFREISPLHEAYARSFSVTSSIPGRGSEIVEENCRGSAQWGEKSMGIVVPNFVVTVPTMLPVSVILPSKR